MGVSRSWRLAVAFALGCLLVLALAAGTPARAKTAEAGPTCDPTTTADGGAGSGSLRA